MPLNEKILAMTAEWQKEVAQQQLSEAEFVELEEAARALGLRVAQAALESLLAAAGPGYAGAALACGCGAKLKFQRYAERPVRTLIGEVRYERAYYYCRACGTGRAPLDEQLGQSARAISAGVERKLACLGAQLSFGAAQRVLTEFGIGLSERQLETVAEEVGDRAQQKSAHEACVASTQALAPARLRLVGAPTRTWVVEMDGVMAGLKDSTWQEVKVGAIYELGQRVEISAGRWELLAKQLCVSRGGVEEFRAQVWALALRSGIRRDERIVVLGDGAEWIDQTLAALFPHATRILDFYHAAERIWEVANLRYGEQTRPAKAWAEAKLTSLKAGRVGAVCRALRRLALPNTYAQARRDETVRYFERHRTAMAYDRYRAAGLPIGSGAIEGSCKHLVAARCKQSGMRWTPEGLDDILALRCWVLNDRLDELCPKPKVKIEWAKAA